MKYQLRFVSSYSITLFGRKQHKRTRPMVYYHQDSSVKSTQMYYFKTYKIYKLKISKQSIKLIYQKKDIASESYFNLPDTLTFPQPSRKEQTPNVLQISNNQYIVTPQHTQKKYRTSIKLLQSPIQIFRYPYKTWGLSTVTMAPSFQPSIATTFFLRKEKELLMLLHTPCTTQESSYLLQYAKQQS